MMPEDYMRVLELGMESYNEEYRKFLEFPCTEKIPYMCLHLETLKHTGKITDKELVATKWFIKENFLTAPCSPKSRIPIQYMTLGTCLVREWNVVDNRVIRIQASRSFYVHVLALYNYNMYDEIPPMKYIVSQMKESHPEWFTR